MNQSLVHMSRSIVNINTTQKHQDYVAGWKGVYRDDKDGGHIEFLMWEKPDNKTVKYYMITAEVHSKTFFKSISRFTYWGTAFEVRNWVKSNFGILTTFSEQDKGINESITQMELHYSGRS
jgi:hypothetical protein